MKIMKLSQHAAKEKLRFNVRLTVQIAIVFALMSGLSGCSVPMPQGAKDAEQTVIKCLEALKNNDYDTWISCWAYANVDDRNGYEKEGDLAVISLSIEKVEMSQGETKRMRKQYTNTELSSHRGWSAEYIRDHMVAVLAKYAVDYDNAKVFYDEGNIVVYLYMLRQDAQSPWLIWSASYNIAE